MLDDPKNPLRNETNLGRMNKLMDQLEADYNKMNETNLPIDDAGRKVNAIEGTSLANTSLSSYTLKKL